MSEIQWKIKHFDELNLKELYGVISLRVEVFVVEQNCPYQDLDGKDDVAYHLIGTDVENSIVATARILPKGISYKEIAIGRVVTSKSIRALKKGNELMQECMKFVKVKFPNENVRLSAQSHLVKYYANHGFKKTGKNYLEDGIPHSEMLYNANVAN